MFYIARIPLTENPEAPDFHEFLCGGGRMPYGWTASPSEALRFDSEAAATTVLSSAPKHIQKSVFIQDDAKLRARVQVSPTANHRLTQSEPPINSYKNRRTYD